MSQTLALRPKRHKVKGSLIRLFKAKEGKQEHKGTRMLKYLKARQPNLIGNSAARASARTVRSKVNRPIKSRNKYFLYILLRIY